MSTSRQAPGIESGERRDAADDDCYYNPNSFNSSPPHHRAAKKTGAVTENEGGESSWSSPAPRAEGGGGVGSAAGRRNNNKKKLKLRAVYALVLVAVVTFQEMHGRSRILPRPSSSSSSSSVALDSGRGQQVEVVRRPGPLSMLSSDADAANVSRTTEGAEQQHHEEKPTIDECSCNFRQDAINATCCQRAIYSAHKFGWILTRNLFRPFRQEISRLWIQSKAFPIPRGTRDYRHVAIVRNYFEAFVSGYLYHKSGRECWLSMFGAPVEPEENFDWELDLQPLAYNVGPYPARNNRSICQYLADESERDGMKVYMAVALQRWYHDVDEYYRIVHDDTHRKDRTMFVCMDDYPDPSSQVTMFGVVMDWLFPGNGHNYTVPPWAINKSPDRNGHASPGNVTHRLELLELVQQLDHDVFNGSVAATNANIGCRGTIHRARR